MIVFLDGEIVSTGRGYVDLAVQHVGYRVFLSDASCARLNPGDEVRIYTHQHVREDAILLYGFMRVEDRAVFERVITVSGIGPKLAMQMIGAIPSNALVSAIVSEDAATLCSLPGIGKKTAQRVILELKDKLDDLPAAWHHTSMPNQTASHSNVEDDAVTALIALGYRQKEAESAIATVIAQHPGANVEDVIRFALAWLYAHASDVAKAAK